MQQRIPPAELELVGLTPTEARVYSALLTGESAGAQVVADRTGLSRGSVYPVLRSLIDKGLVESGAGYGSRFRVAPPERAIPSLIDRQREELAKREETAKELVERLVELVGPGGDDGEQVIQILRTPRVIVDRFNNLELATEETIDALVKGPIFEPKGNPGLKKVLRRGVKVRALYEPEILDAQGVGSFLREWIELGEQARVYSGELPIKLTLFDQRVALLPLETPTLGSAVTAVIIRHGGLGSALRIMFDSLWEGSEELMPT